MIEHTDPITGRHTVNGIGPDDQVRNTRTGQTGTVTFASPAHDVHVVPDGAPVGANGYTHAEIWRLADVEKVEADAAMTAKNRKSPYEQVREAMATQTAAQTSEGLCVALMAIDGDSLAEPERIVRGILEEELVTRHPEADAASIRWSDGLEGDKSHAEVIVAAVLKVLENDAS